MLLRKIPLILPAAGQSSRLGIPKGLKQHHGRRWLDLQCEAYFRAGGRTVFLVLGYARDEYRNALTISKEDSPGRVQISGCEVHILDNPLPEFGPFSSLQEACRRIRQEGEYSAAFYLPIDTPVPFAEVLEALLNALKPGVWAAEPRLGRAGGHPILLSREFMEHIANLNVEEEGARLDTQMQRARDQGTAAPVAVDDLRVAMNLNDADSWRYFENYERRQREESPSSSHGDEASDSVLIFK